MISIASLSHGFNINTTLLYINHIITSSTYKEMTDYKLFLVINIAHEPNIFKRVIIGT